MKKNRACSNLSKELRKQLRKRALPVRKGDKVRVMRGTHHGKTAKVMSVDRGKGVVLIEKITRKKADGREVNIPFYASKLQIIEIEGKDERRIKARGKARAKAEKVEEKKEEKVK